MEQDEVKVLDLLDAAWNAYSELSHFWGDGGHAKDKEDFAFLIHRLQDMVAARVGCRLLREQEALAKSKEG